MSKRLILAIGLGVVAAGCGDPGPSAHIEKVVPVSGTLTYRGQPLEYHQVIFRATDGRRTAIGITDAAGKFTLGTNGKDDGAPPGSHKVGINYVGPPIVDDPSKEPIDPAFRPKPKIQIPANYADPETSGLTQEVPAGGLTDLKIDLK